MGGPVACGDGDPGKSGEGRAAEVAAGARILLRDVHVRGAEGRREAAEVARPLRGKTTGEMSPPVGRFQGIFIVSQSPDVRAVFSENSQKNLSPPVEKSVKCGILKEETRYRIPGKSHRR